MEEATISVTFDLQMLWLIHSSLQAEERERLRREDEATCRAAYPPPLLGLSDKVAEGILFAEEFDEPTVVLQLTRSECLVVDSTVPDDAKTVDGAPIGRTVHLLQFAARRGLQAGRSSLPSFYSSLSKVEFVDSTNGDDADAYQDTDSD